MRIIRITPYGVEAMEATLYTKHGCKNFNLKHGSQGVGNVYSVGICNKTIPETNGDKDFIMSKGNYDLIPIYQLVGQEYIPKINSFNEQMYYIKKVTSYSTVQSNLIFLSPSIEEGDTVTITGEYECIGNGYLHNTNRERIAAPVIHTRGPCKIVWFEHSTGKTKICYISTNGDITEKEVVS